MKQLAAKLLIAVTLVTTNFAPAIAEVDHQHKIRVALFFGKGVGKGEHRSGTAVKNMLLDSDEFATKVVYGEEIKDGSLSDFDIVVFPGGSGNMEAHDMGEVGRRELKRFVSEGGIYFGVCAGCYLASDSKPQYLGLIPLRTADPKHWHRGEAVLPVQFTQLGTEVFGLKEADQHILYCNGPVFAAPQDQSRLDGMQPLAFFKGEKVAPGGERGIMVNAPAAVLAHYGRGVVLGLSPHPELTPGLKKIELHALHWMYEHRNTAG